MQPQVAVYYKTLRGVYGRPGPAGRDAFVERSLERSQDGGYRTIEVAWEWCYRGFLNTLSPISTSVSLDETPRYSIQKTPSLERSTERSNLRLHGAPKASYL